MDEVFEFLNGSLLSGIGLLFSGQTQGLLFHIVAVIALVGVETMMAQFQDLVDHLIQEITVVGNQEEGALVASQVSFQPG